MMMVMMSKDDNDGLHAGEFEPERHLVAHKADGRDKQAGPAGPFNVAIFTKSHNFDQKVTISNKGQLKVEKFD